MANVMSKLLLMALPLLLGGCVSTLVAAGGSLEDFSLRKFLRLEPEEQQEVVETPLYCYETLAREECYSEPLAGAEGRLQGFVGPVPTHSMR